MRADFRQFIELLVDPLDGSHLRLSDDEDALVSTSGMRRELVSGIPNLLPTGGLTLGLWTFPEVVVGDDARPKPIGEFRRTIQKVKQEWLAPVSQRADAHALLRSELADLATHEPARVLVVGGATLGAGAGWMVDDPAVLYAAFDLYPTAQTAFLGDAHRIPVADGSVDAVWIQAVLEHVYRPDVVVREIHRVLKPRGLVYAETPFLQPVHEAAFDFTRFSVSGHTLLFEGFEAILAGPIGGPGALMNLAMRGTAEGLTRSRQAARVAYAFSLPLRLLDRLVSANTRRDYCIGAYLLARRSDATPREVDPIVLFERPASRPGE